MDHQKIQFLNARLHNICLPLTMQQFRLIWWFAWGCFHWNNGICYGSLHQPQAVILPLTYSLFLFLEFSPPCANSILLSSCISNNENSPSMRYLGAHGIYMIPHVYTSALWLLCEDMSSFFTNDKTTLYKLRAMLTNILYRSHYNALHVHARNNSKMHMQVSESQQFLFLSKMNLDGNQIEIWSQCHASYFGS